MARSVRDGSRRDATLFLACIVLALVVRALPLQTREPLSAALRQTVVRPLVAMQHSAERTRSAWLGYERLTISRDSIALRAMQVHSLEAENKRLRELLALGDRLVSGFIPAEALHGQLLGEETTVLLSVGSDAGVRRYSPVVAPEGLVGVVQTVDPTMSVAILLSHPQLRPSAKSADGAAFGIVRPHVSDGDRPERFLLEMQGVQFRNPLDSGTVILTAGSGGVFPEGIPIGTVLGELKTAELWSRTYLVRPAVPPPDVRSVMILKQDRTGAGLQRVWTIPRADSIARSVARAGDSIARLDRARIEAATPSLVPAGIGGDSATRGVTSGSSTTPLSRPSATSQPPVQSSPVVRRAPAPAPVITTPPVVAPPNSTPPPGRGAPPINPAPPPGGTPPVTPPLPPVIPPPPPGAYASPDEASAR